MLEDSRGIFWVGSMGGLDILDRASGTFSPYKHENNSITASPIRVLYEDSQSNIWFGTEGRGLGLISRTEQRIKTFTMEDGLPSSTIHSIIEDRLGNMWFGTINGLSQLNMTDLSFHNFFKSDGLAGNNHNRKAAYKDENGILYFGSTNGISYFDPSSLRLNKSEAKLHLTEFKIHNQLVLPESANSPLKTTIGYAETLRLNHSQNTFSFKFSLLNYRTPYRNHYYYKLDGFDTNWNDIRHQRTATYTNVNPGSYLLQVKAKNSDGIWSSNVIQLPISLLPAPWASWWAYMSYAICIALLSGWAIRYQIRRIEFEKQRTLNTELVQLDKIKNRFLSSTSHELRTPVSGIISLAEMVLIDKNQDQEQVQHYLTTIISCGHRLLHLINDILDYSRIIDKRLELHTTSVRFGKVVQHCIALLASTAQKKSIQLLADENAYDYQVIADENRLQQIVLNLLDNAIKHSAGGTVKVSARAKQSVLEVSVHDDGIGIPAEQRKSVFDSFYQINYGDRYAEGTGLGLAITKELIELHGGKIWIESGTLRGSKFMFSIPLDTKAPSIESSSHFHSKDASHLQSLIKIPSATEFSDSNLNTSCKKEHEENNVKALYENFDPEDKTIVVIDDHAVNRLVFRHILEEEGYRVVEYSGGSEAVEQLRNQTLHADLILLDTRMPQMSGFETSRLIRQFLSEKQLPIIFTSVDRNHDDINKSRQSGGNAFLEKPISQQQLIHAVANHLTQITPSPTANEVLRRHIKKPNI